MKLHNINIHLNDMYTLINVKISFSAMGALRTFQMRMKGQDLQHLIEPMRVLAGPATELKMNFVKVC